MYYQKRKIISGTMIFTGLWSGVTAYALDIKSAKESVQQEIYEITGKDSATLKFEKGSTVLSEAADSELKTMLNAVRDREQVRGVMVLAHSDLAYPYTQTSDLPKASQALASKRGDVVAKRLEQLGAKKIKTLNMATKSKWYDKAFVTKEAQVKDEASVKPQDADLDDVFYEAVGHRLNADGGPGTVVVVIRHSGQFKK